MKIIKMGKNKETGYVHNCIIKIKQNQKHPVFTQREDGLVICCLDGYAIIPKEEYNIQQ